MLYAQHQSDYVNVQSNIILNADMHVSINYNQQVLNALSLIRYPWYMKHNFNQTQSHYYNNDDSL